MRMFRWLLDSRFLATLLVITIILALRLAGVADVLAPAKNELYDQLVKSRRNTLGGDAPPVVNLAFDRKSRAEYWAKAMPGSSFSQWPTVTPLALIGRTLNLVKAGCERKAGDGACPRIIVVDIDVKAVGAHRDDREFADFTHVLEAWASSPRLPMIAFVRAPEWKDPDAGYDGKDDRFVLAPAPAWDDIVRKAPNLTWASGEALADEDGIVRQLAYYTCVRSPASGKAITLPHASLFALAAWHAYAKQAKAIIQRDLSDLCQKTEGDTASSFALSVSPETTYRFRERIGLIGYHLADPARFGPSPVLSPASGAPGSRTVQVLSLNILMAPNATTDFADNAILVISSTQPTFEDIHWSPYGPMAGGLILANSARSLILDGPMRGLSSWLSPWLLLLSCVGIHAFTVGMHSWHHRLRLRPEQKPTRAGNVLRAATSAEGAKFVSLIAVFAIGRFTGLWLAPYAMWESTAIMGFVVVMYCVFNELYEAWSARNDTA